MQRGKQSAQRRQRVHDRATEYAGVYGAFQHPHLDLAVDEAAEAGGERRNVHAPVHRVCDHDHIGAQAVAIRLKEGGERRRADLFLSLGKEHHTHRRAAVESPQRRDVRHHSGFVVRGAPAEEAAVALRGLERLARPVIDVAGRLDVVVCVEKNRGRTVRRRPVGHHRRCTSVDRQDLGIHRSGLPGQVRDGLRTGAHGRRRRRIGAHAWDSDEPFEVCTGGRQHGLYGVTQISHKRAL